MKAKAFVSAEREITGVVKEVVTVQAKQFITFTFFEKLEFLFSRKQPYFFHEIRYEANSQRIFYNGKLDFKVIDKHFNFDLSECTLSTGDEIELNFNNNKKES